MAQLIANGNADAGLAIRAAAHAFDLDFVSVAWEPYELALPEAALDEPRMQLLIEILRDPAFRADVEALGGYDTSRGGDVRVVMPAAAAAR